MLGKFDSLSTRNSLARNDVRGFTLLELIFSMLIFLIVMGAVIGVLQLAQQSRKVTNQQVQLTKNVRIALNLLGRDTYNAGFGYPLSSAVVLPDNRITSLIGVPGDFDTSRDTVPPIIAGNNITLNTYNTAANVRTDQVTFLFKDSTFNIVNGVSQSLNINSPTTVNGIDQIVPLSGSNAACRVNDIYLITGNTGSALGVVTSLVGTNTIQFANADPLGFNQSGVALTGITLPASLQRVNLVTYFVTADGVLTRREYANTNVAPPAVASPLNFRDEPLVYGVEDFQIKYVMDDGTISDNPAAGADGIQGNEDDMQSNLYKVRQVRFTISIKTVEVDERGRPFRATMSSTFSTRNLGYDAS